MNAYAKYFDKDSKQINLLLKDKEISKRYSQIRNKIKSLMKKEFNSEPVYNDKYIKTTMMLYIQIFNIIKYLKIMNIVHAYL